MMKRELPRTSGGPLTPKPKRCEWCQQGNAVRTIELTSGRKVKAGYKAAHTIKVCPSCEKIIERNR